MISKIRFAFAKLSNDFLLKKSASVFIFRITGMLLAYAMMILVTNYLGAKGYGRFTLSVTLLQFLILISSLGIPTALVKLTADKSNFNFNQPQNNYLKNSIVLVLSATILISILLFLVKDYLAINLFKDSKLIDYFKLLSYGLLLCVMHLFILEFLRGKLKFKSYAFGFYILPYLIFIAFFYVFKKINAPEEYFFLCFVLGLSITALFFLKALPFKNMYKNHLPFSYKKILNISFPMLLTSGFVFLINWTDVFMLGAMVSKEEVGIYNAAYKLGTIALITIHVVNAVLAPKIAEFYSKNDIKSIESIVVKATRIITIFTVPVVLILIFFRKNILKFFGTEFIDGEYVLIIVLIGLLFNALSGSVAQLLNMTKHQKELRNFTIIAAIINILFNYVLISKHGIFGAAIASAISQILLNMLCIIYIKRKFNFYAFFRL